MQEQDNQPNESLKRRIYRTDRITLVVSVILIAIIGYSLIQDRHKNKIPRLYQAAFQAESLGNYDEAMEHYLEILETNANEAGAYIGLGNIYFRKKKYDNAIESFQRYLSFNPKELSVYINIAIVYSTQKNYEKAEETYLNALSIDPKSAEIYYNYGNMLYVKGEPRLAVEKYKTALDLNPGFAMAANNLGHVYISLEQYRDAIEIYQRALELPPLKNAPMANLTDLEKIYTRANLAELYFITGQPGKAVKEANAVLDIKEISPSSRLGVQFISAAALLVHSDQDPNNTKEVFKAILEYYRSLKKEYKREWKYDTVKKYIEGNVSFSNSHRDLLLKFIDLLESPKAEGDKKAEQLEGLL